MKSQQDELLSKYDYNKDKPLFSASNYTVYHATMKQSNLPVTIKTLKYPHVELGTYLQKVKDCKSQNVIKIYQLLIEQQFLVIITEPILFGNIKKALTKSTYLDQPDTIFIAKQILNGHVDLLRSDINWFGTQEDIQFAQDGQIKLSWNNGCSFNLVNSLPAILTKISTRSSQVNLNDILPFPMSKTLQQLLRISKENASEIAINPQMKKKQKAPKRKGNNWIALKQYKNKNEYFDQLSYFSVHSEHGFIRVKVYEQGKVSPNLIQLNKTKQTFTKVYEMYDQNNKTIILSDYSNDGSIQSYLTRLKTAGVKIKEDQIQYLVYSLFQPLKMVQQSSLKAMCMLHIRNVYIENGIPKIGQPVPINQKIIEVMADRKEVPDFYHPDFKGDTNLRQQKFDTYSLGVLLYKLMYNDAIIFREPGVVQVPSTPSYNKRLKQTLQLFFNLNSTTIRQIETKIQMNEQVKTIIDQIKQKLKKSKETNKKDEDKDKKQGLGHESQDENHHQNQQHQSSSDDQQGNPKHEEEQDDDQEGPGCCDIIRKKIHIKDPKKLDSQKRKAFVDQLQLSSFKNFRLWTKSVAILSLYVFLFYYQFIQNSIFLLASQGLLTKIDLVAGTKNVSVISTDKYEFEAVFNHTGQNINDLENMNCIIEDKLMVNKYSDFLKEDSQIWYGYLFGGIGAFLLVLIFKVIQIHIFDDINAWFRKQQGSGHFNLWNWILLNFHWLGLISGHYFLFNFTFEPQIEPCVGYKNGNQWGSTSALFNDHNKFIAPYSVIFGMQIFVFICYLILVIKNSQMTEKYNKLMNTLSIFGSLLLIIWLIIRFGIILKSSYYPAALTDKNRIIITEIKDSNYLMLFAIVPQLLFIMQIVIIIVINWVYYAFIDKAQRLLNNDASLDASLKDIL